MHDDTPLTEQEKREALVTALRLLFADLPLEKIGRAISEAEPSIECIPSGEIYRLHTFLHTNIQDLERTLNELKNGYQVRPYPF